MDYFSIKKTFLPFCLTYDDKIVKHLEKFILLLKNSGVEKFLKQPIPNGRPGYSLDRLLATALYGFAFGSGTLRDLEDDCKYNLKYKYLMDNEEPSFQTFSYFLNTIVKPNCEELFHLITKEIAKEIGASIHDYAFIDGTKFEADCNKYKFVWKPTTYHNNLTKKVIQLLAPFNLSKDIDPDTLISSKEIVQLIDKLSSLENKEIDISLKTKTLKELMKKLSKVLEYEEKERICGPDRKSYYKTDHDATAMCLKDDYYAGLGSSMHAAYSTQIVVSNYLISSYLVSQSRTDMHDFIKVLHVYFKNYKCFPKKICADAGYGSEDNYKFMDENKIKPFVKFQTREGNVSGKNPERYRLYDKEGYIKCLYGRIGLKVKVDYRPRYSNSTFYKIFNCAYCSVIDYCKLFMSEENKMKNYKVFEVRNDFSLLKEQNEKNLLSVEGIEMRVNRSMQVEGAYGVIKQDLPYIRLRRTGLDSVNMEISLVFLGYNIRKFFSFLDGKQITKYRKAPPETRNQVFKEPNFKKLGKKKAKKEKEPNQMAKDKYRNKGKKDRQVKLS